MEYIKIYKKAVQWIKEHSIEARGIAVTSEQMIPYPEVTGYYIPTLIKWGYKDLALNYAKWLCSIQNKDGSWYSADGKASYVFDSAQILKGLLAIHVIYPEVKENLIKGCDWLLSNIQEDGRLTTPSKDAWGGGGGGMF